MFHCNWYAILIRGFCIAAVTLRFWSQSKLQIDVFHPQIYDRKILLDLGHFGNSNKMISATSKNAAHCRDCEIGLSVCYLLKYLSIAGTVMVLI